MALRSFSNKTLNGNWYEDRWAPPQASQMYPQDRSLRPHEEAISTLSASGLPQPLEVIKRLPKWNTTGVIPDDGYREDYTVNKTEIPNPAAVREVLHKRPALVDQATGATKPLLAQQNFTELTHVK